MKTESGATSIGAPGSAARIEEEAAHAIRGDTYNTLLLTDEGRELLTRFARSVGCDFTKMDNLEASNWIDTESKSLFSFLVGVRFMYDKVTLAAQRELTMRIIGDKDGI